MTTVLNLGGTIALSEDEAGRPVTLSGPELLGDGHTFIEVQPVQSNALSWTHLIGLRDELLAVTQRGETGAVVITGTGTAEDVATFLQAAAPAGVRVAMLVSFESATRGRRAPGIDAAVQWLESATDGRLCLFADGMPFGYPFTKRWADGAWEFVSPTPDTLLPRWRLPETARLAPDMPLVPVVTAGIGCGPWVRQVIEEVPGSALVLEAYGAGDVPPEIVPSVEWKLAQGGHVVVTSHGRPGRVEPTYPGIPGTSHGLFAMGCHSGGLMTSRQARMRLAVALASGDATAPACAFERFPPDPSSK